MRKLRSQRQQSVARAHLGHPARTSSWNWLSPWPQAIINTHQNTQPQGSWCSTEFPAAHSSPGHWCNCMIPHAAAASHHPGFQRSEQQMGAPPLTQATHEVVTGPHGGRLGQVALVHTRGWEGGKGSPKRVGRRLQAALTIPGCPVCTLGGQKLSQTTVSMSLRSGAFPEGRCYKNNPRRKALCRLNCCCL